MLLKILYALIIADLTLSASLIIAKGGKFTLFSFINYEFAFLSTLLIVFLSFLSYKKGVLRVLREEKFTDFGAKNGENVSQKNDKMGENFGLKNDKNGDLKSGENADEMGVGEVENKTPIKVKKFTLFFSVAKIAAYFLLALGFIALSKSGHLDILAFLLGASGVVVAVFAYMILTKFTK